MLMTIGEFATRTRLSPKALRLYDDMGLVLPAQVDEGSAYRRYAEDQIPLARLVGHLRRAGLPLAQIESILAMDRADGAEALAAWWCDIESVTNERRAMVVYLQAHLRGEDLPMYDIQLRSISERRVASINRHVQPDETDQFFADAFGRLRAAGPGLDGIAGLPYLVFYGEVSQDSDGPIELSRPLAGATGQGPPGDGLDVRTEPAHEEAFIRLSLKEMGWPAMFPVYDALEAWLAEHKRTASAPVRQVLLADQRTATPDAAVCDLSVPLTD